MLDDLVKPQVLRIDRQCDWFGRLPFRLCRCEPFGDDANGAGCGAVKREMTTCVSLAEELAGCGVVNLCAGDDCSALVNYLAGDLRLSWRGFTGGLRLRAHRS